MTRDELRAALAVPNVQAFLRVVRAGEGTSDADGYRRMFTGALFDDFAQHPNQLHRAGALSSTAAGAYQFLFRTWSALVAQYGFPDFSPACQDEGAVALIAGRGALDAVAAGRLAEAIGKCNREWASLPGSPYGQPTRTMAQALRTFQEAGGVLAATSPSPTPQKEQEAMIPFVAAALPALIQAAPALIRIFGDSPQAEKNAKAAEVVADIAKEATGEPTVEGAVGAIQADSSMAAAYREAVHARMGRLVDMMERINAMEQANIGAARQYNRDEPLMLDLPWLRLRFIHVLSLVLVGFSGWFVARYWPDLTPELKGAVITLMVIAGWNGVKDYWMGSSSGSERKTAMLSERRE